MPWTPSDNSQSDLDKWRERQQAALVQPMPLPGGRYQNPELGDLRPDMLPTDPELAARVPALSPETKFDTRPGYEPYQNPELGDLEAGRLPPNKVTPDRQRVSASSLSNPVQAQALAQQMSPKPAAINAGPEGRSPWASFLTQLPNSIGNLVAASQVGKLHGQGAPVLQGINQRNEQNQEMGQADEAARLAHSKRVQYLTRQAGQDQLVAQDRQHANEDRAARIEKDKEHADPASPTNAMFRKDFASTYPEAWAKLSPEEQASFTVERAKALGGSTGRADALALAKAKEQEHNRTFGDQQTLQSQKDAAAMERAKLRKGAGGTWAGPSSDTKEPAPEGIDPAAWDAANKIPKLGERQRAKLALMAVKNKPKPAAKPGADPNAVEKGYHITDEVANARALATGGTRDKRRASMVAGDIINRDMPKMIELRKKLGPTVFGSEAKGEFDTLHGNVIGAITDLYHSGVLNDKEFERYINLVPNTAPHLSDVTKAWGKDSTEEQLKGAHTGLMELNKRNLQGYGVARDEAGPDPSQAPAQTKSGTVAMRKGGVEKDIPADQVELAKQHGWQ